MIEWLERSGHDEITLRDLASVIEGGWDGATHRRVAHELVQLGVLQRRMPSVFTVLKPGQVAPPVTLGERLDWSTNERYAIAYGSAMSVHGLPPAMDSNERIHVMRSYPCSSLPADLAPKVRDHQRRRRLTDTERVDHPALGQITVRSAQRTLVDGAERPEHCGGIERVVRFLALTLRTTGAAELAASLDAKTPRAAVCRLGYLLELARAPSASLASLRYRALGDYYPLDPSLGRGRLERSWRLRLNVPEDALRAALT